MVIQTIDDDAAAGEIARIYAEAKATTARP